MHDLGEGRVGLFAQSERRCHRLGDEPSVGQRGQLDPPDAVVDGLVLDQLPGDLLGQPRLAHTARAGERDEPRATGQQAEHRPGFVRPTDKEENRYRQVVRGPASHDQLRATLGLVPR